MKLKNIFIAVSMILLTNSLRADVNVKLVPSVNPDNWRLKKIVDSIRVGSDFLKYINEIKGALAEESLSREDRAIGYVFLAYAYLGSGEEEKAKTSLKSLLEHYPEGIISAEDWGTSFAQLFDKVRKEVIGFISLSTNPEGADVIIDSISLNFKTPTENIPVPSGLRNIKVIKEGYKSYSMQVQILPNQKTTLNWELNKITTEKTVLKQPKIFELPANAGEWILASISISSSIISLISFIEANKIKNEIENPYDKFQSEIDNLMSDWKNFSTIHNITLGTTILSLSGYFYQKIQKRLKFKSNIEISLKPKNLKSVKVNFKVNF